MFKTGQIPEILITDVQPDTPVVSRNIPTDKCESISKDKNLLKVPLDILSEGKPKEMTPLVYEVNCVCDRIAGSQTEVTVPNTSTRPSNSLKKALELAEKDPDFWPKGTPSNQNTWDTLPVKQIASKTDTNEGNGNAHPTRVVRKVQSATATLDPVTRKQLNEVKGPVTQPVRLPSVASKGNSKLSQGSTRGDLLRGPGEIYRVGFTMLKAVPPSPVSL